MADLEEKNKNLSPNSATAVADAPAQPEKAKETVAQEEKKAPKKDKKGARFLFNMVNWLGINWLFNSGLSLWITFNSLPTPTAQASIRGLGKWVFRPIAIGMDKVRGLFSKNEVQTLAEKELKIAEHARSTAEVFCMFIAGSIALIPMMFIEKRKDKIIDTFDHWLHPGKKKQEQQNGENSEPPAEEKKMKWGELLKARVLGMAAILGINAGMQAYNNATIQVDPKKKDKWINSDTAKWFNSDIVETRFGHWLFDKCPEAVRHKIIWVFSGFSSKRISIESIQEAMRVRAFKDAPDRLRDIVGELADLNKYVENHPDIDKAKGFWDRKKQFERLRAEIHPTREKLLTEIASHPEWKPTVEKAIFAEQTRLFSKEVSLTLAITAFMYLFAKTGVISWCMERCGLKRKKKASPELETPIQPQPIENASDNVSELTDANQKRWTEHEGNQLGRNKPAAPKTSFAEAAAQSQGKEASVSV